MKWKHKLYNFVMYNLKFCICVQFKKKIHRFKIYWAHFQRYSVQIFTQQTNLFFWFYTTDSFPPPHFHDLEIAHFRDWTLCVWLILWFSNFTIQISTIICLGSWTLSAVLRSLLCGVCVYFTTSILCTLYSRVGRFCTFLNFMQSHVVCCSPRGTTIF